MNDKTIEVTSNKITSLRVTQKTKKMLEALAIKKETHEDIILRLIKMAKNLSDENGSKLIERGNVTGTKYERIHRTFKIKTEKANYSVVCTYNDLILLSMLRANKRLKGYISNRNKEFDWEVDLEIVNVRIEEGKWEEPINLKSKDRKEYLLIYLVVLKDILEETFDINIYEITALNDYFERDKWERAYKENNLSLESFHSDVQKKLREI
ncbi:MAG: hypothetical protein KKD17_02905 [Nanoarchaeota archaeon]|nr:hypothetical protein [Nanoarchaeota archaeon]